MDVEVGVVGDRSFSACWLVGMSGCAVIGMTRAGGLLQRLMGLQALVGFDGGG